MQEGKLNIVRKCLRNLRETRIDIRENRRKKLGLKSGIWMYGMIVMFFL